MEKESTFPSSKVSKEESGGNNATIQMYLELMSLSFHSKQLDSAPPSPTPSERDLSEEREIASDMRIYSWIHELPSYNSKRIDRTENKIFDLNKKYWT